VKVALVGAGGIGGYLGARLAQAGEDVAFIARGAHLAAMQRDGLRLTSPNGDLHLRTVRATADPQAVGPVDVVVVAVKLWDLESALQTALPLLGARTAVVGFQNGMEKETIIGRIAGAQRVIGGAVYISAEIERPGVILHKGTLERFIIGETDGRTSERVTALHTVCANAGIKIEISGDIVRAIWEKFVFLASHAALTTLLRLPIGPIRENPQSRSLLSDALGEVVALARAKGIRLAPDFLEECLAFIDRQPAATRASMAVDLERGNRLEVDWLSGAVVRLGRELGIATPVHRVAADGLAPFAAGRPPET
jgi:2-dehydropantoate 2-reductase